MKVTTPCIGQIVLSIQGRDKGRFYVVYRIEKDRLLLVDGARRTRKSPKVKNIKHLRVLPDLVKIPEDGAYERQAASITAKYKTEE